MWLLLSAYLIALAIDGSGFHLWVDGVLCVVTQFLPAVVCWLSLPHAEGRRREVAWLAAGCTAFASGNVLLVVAEAQHRTLPVPSAASVGYLAFYPAVVVAVLLAVRRERPAEQAALWLDGLLGGVAAAACVALALAPAFRNVHGGLLSAGVSLAFPVFDLGLVVVLVAIAVLQRAVYLPWLMLIAGFAVFAGTDVVYDWWIAHGSYVIGTPLDAFWAVGLALMSMWARPATTQARGTNLHHRSGALVVPALATATGLAILLLGTRTRIPIAATVLAAVAIILTAVRTHFAFRQQRRLFDLRRQATTDDLTGLPNRRAFSRHVETELSRFPTAAMLLLDLDKFKEVNDTLGHHVGDQLLVDVGGRLAAQLRDSDVLARLGGDEFALLLSRAGRAQAEVVAAKIRSALAAPFALGEITLSATASVGIALAPDHGGDISQLLRRADIAMYKAKRSRSGHDIYAEADDRDFDERLSLIQDLRAAVSTDEQLLLHYQPKFELATGDVHGVEALVRWDHPTRGLLYPGAFLGLVEEAGLMPALTDRVLAIALDQAASWAAIGHRMTIAVNLSASSLVDDELPEHVMAMLADRELPSSALQLEITEEFLMSDRDRARRILHRLREHGVRISVDDFGTGYSSLSYLRELPIDELKLDRSFVFPMADDARAAALVVSAIGLAHSLGLRMVAEGVEDSTALSELIRHGCDEAQGFFLSRPVPAAEFEYWLSNRTSSFALPSGYSWVAPASAEPG
jgi:diguanylate cyclase (GGDEF)-like protein